MKKTQYSTILKIILLLIFFIYCLTESALVKESIYEALNRCLTIIIPSLYAVMAVSGIISKSGIINFFPKSRMFFIFVLSIFSGYPVGTKMLCSEYQNGNISKKEAELFSGICYGAGSAFIFGCISTQLYSNNSAGKLILVSNILSSLIVFVIAVILNKKNTHDYKRGELRFNADMVTESVVNSGKAVTDICFAIIAFAVIESFLKNTGIFYNISNFLKITPEKLSVILDITNVNHLPKDDYTLLPFLSAIVSFGGLCVIFQLSAVTSSKISLLPLVITRLFTSILSFVICRLLMPLFIIGESVAVSAIKIYKSQSPVPSILLVLMTISLFYEHGKIKTDGC